MNSFISLEELQIARPCRANWSQMTGDQRARFCGSCHKNVYDISQMTREAAYALIAEKEGDVCLRLHRRLDGTVITSDCPVGQRESARPAWWNVAAIVALVGAGLAGCASSTQAPAPVAPIDALDKPVETQQAVPQAPTVRAEAPPLNFGDIEPLSFTNGPAPSANSAEHAGVTMGAPMMPRPTATSTPNAPLATETTMGETAPIHPQSR